MAYVIFNSQKEVSFLAANEVEKNDINFDSSFYIKTISDEDFSKLKQNIAKASLDGDNVVITDVPQTIDEEQPSDPNSWVNLSIRTHHDDLKFRIESYLQRFDSSNSIYTQAQNYLNTLKTVDYESLNIPVPKTWETYCEENSIEYLNTLQLY